MDCIHALVDLANRKTTYSKPLRKSIVNWQLELRGEANAAAVVNEEPWLVHVDFNENEM